MDYNKLLEKARKVYAECVTNAEKRKLESVFPELAQSEDEMIRKEIIAFIEQSIHRGGGTPIPQEQENKWIAWLEKQEKQNPIWSKKDNLILQRIIQDLVSLSYECQVDFNDKLNWLKSLRDRLQPQPKQEWGKEDEVMLQTTIDTLEDFSKGKLPLSDSGYDIAIAEIQWLKSLKPQPHWKPTEAQMNALYWAEQYSDGKLKKNVLNSLYNDLKKL